MKRWAIRYPRTDRYFIGYMWDKAEDDYLPAWGEKGDTSKAELFTSKEGAEDYIKHVLCYGGLGCEAVEIKEQ